MNDQRRDRLWRLVASRAGQHVETRWAALVCEVASAETGVDAAAITVRSSTRAEEPVAATDDWALRLEELQYTLGEGPGVEAHGLGGPVLVAHLSEAVTRWPGFSPAALEIGAAAVFAFPLHAGAIRLGTLDLYRRRAGPLSADGLAGAAALADIAITAVLADAGGDQPAYWARENTPSHYEDVSVASGMLAVQLHISVEDAFIRLRAHAFSQNRPILDVARDVLRRQLRFNSTD